MSGTGFQPTIESLKQRQLFRFLLPATGAYQLTLTSLPTDYILGSVTITGLPIGAVIRHLYMHLKFSERNNTNGSTNLVCDAQNIQASIDGLTWQTGIELFGGEYSTPGSTYGFAGDVMLGTADLISLAPVSGDTLYFQWTQGWSQYNNLFFANVQIISELLYSAG